jgi:hypothetical protein
VPAHDVPPAVERLLELLVGNDWPDGSEGDLRGMATGWRDLATGLQRITEDTETAVAHVARGVSGPALDSFQAFIGPIIASDGYLTGIVTTCTGLADALDAMALEIETLRILIIEQLIFLAAQIAADIAAAPFTFGASAALIEAEMVATRTVVATVIRRSIIGLLAHLAESIANQTVTTFIAQFIEWCQKRRPGLDGRQVALAARNGLIGGTVGFGMGNLGGLGKSGIGKLTQDHIPTAGVLTHVPDAVRNTLGGLAKTPFDVGWGQPVARRKPPPRTLRPVVWETT